MYDQEVKMAASLISTFLRWLFAIGVVIGLIIAGIVYLVVR